MKKSKPMKGVIMRLPAIPMLLLALAPRASQSETTTIEVPLMGKGELAILDVKSDVVSLANLNTAVERGGVLYFDKHTRFKGEISGDPPQIEIIARTKLDCNSMDVDILSFTTRNFHTLQNAESSKSLEGSGSEPILRGSSNYILCESINKGESFYLSMMNSHYFGLDEFPKFALSSWDAFDIEEVDESGEITKFSDSALLKYLKKNNRNF